MKKRGWPKGKPKSKEMREKISIACKGKKRSKEACQRMREAALKMWQDPKYRKKVVEGRKVAHKSTTK